MVWNHLWKSCLIDQGACGCLNPLRRCPSKRVDVWHYDVNCIQSNIFDRCSLKIMTTLVHSQQFVFSFLGLLFLEACQRLIFSSLTHAAFLRASPQHRSFSVTPGLDDEDDNVNTGYWASFNGVRQAGTSSDVTFTDCHTIIRFDS